MNIQKQHFAWLDAMRLIAAFLVLLCHSRNDFFLKYNFLESDQQGAISSLFYLIGRMGSEAVFVFFILSGFLVGGVGLERIMNSHFNLKSYTINRSVRIMIPLLSAIVLFVIVAPIVGEEIHWGRVIGNLSSLQCIICDPLVSPFWSLSYEVWFYITLAAFALIIRKKRSGYILFAVCCLAYTKMNPLYLLMWLIGAAAYLTRPKVFNKWHFAINIIFVFIAIALTQMTKASKALSFDLPYWGEGYNLLLCICIGWFIQQVILLKPNKRWVQSTEKLFGRLADFSYTLYLTHRIVLLVIFTLFLEKEKADLSLQNIGVFVLIMIVCLLVAYGVYWVAEKRTEVVKTWVKNKLIF